MFTWRRRLGRQRMLLFPSDIGEVVQPWIEEQLFRPLRTRGVEVVHVDRRELRGVDVRADLTNHDDVVRLGALHPGALLCCNLLEHVTEPDRLAYHCLELLMPGGLVFVTVPFSYPYHRDPIDTMYRPSPSGWGSHTATWCASGHN